MLVIEFYLSNAEKDTDVFAMVTAWAHYNIKCIVTDLSTVDEMR